jgi:hypothetical protein
MSNPVISPVKHVEGKRGSSEILDAPGTGEADTDEAWAAVRRIGSSKVFEKSPRIRELFLVVARESLEGRPENLSEYELGRAVFHRRDDYVPNEDSIVRSSIRQLRRKLREYYETEGASDACVVEIPKGCYVAQFHLRGSGPLVEPALPATANSERSRLGFSVLVGALIVSAIANVVLLTGFARSFPPSRSRVLGLAPALVMSSAEHTQLITDDYAYVLLAHIAGKHYSLEQYIDRSYVDPANAPSHDPALMNLWNLLSTRYVVSVGSLGTVERVLRSVPDQEKIIVRHARNLAGRDFQGGNLILFGSPPNNPWSRLYEDKLNFKLVRNGSHAEFVNMNPRAGESVHYGTPQNSSINSGPGYARLAYLPGASGNSFVLLLTGLNMVTAEAAAEYATNPKYTPEVLRLLGGNLKQLPHFEMLLRTSAFDSTPKDVVAVALRNLDKPVE